MNRQGQSGPDTVTLFLDGNKTLECEILAVFEMNDKKYAALLPLDSDKFSEDDVLFYYYDDRKGKEPEFCNITDDDEYEDVADAFDEMLDDEEYDEMYSDSDD